MAVRPGAGDHQHRHDRAELGDRADRGAGAGDVGGAELGQQEVEREDEQHGFRDGHRDGGQQRYPHEEPASPDELAPFERLLQGFAGQHAHSEEPAGHFRPWSDPVDYFAANHVRGSHRRGPRRNHAGRVATAARVPVDVVITAPSRRNRVPRGVAADHVARLPLAKTRLGDRGAGTDIAHGFAALIARWHGSGSACSRPDTESQCFHCLLKRATHSRGMEMATVDAIPIRKLSRRVTMLRKAIR